MPVRYIDPVKDFGSLLLKIDKPARYVGGEAGRLVCNPEKKEENFKTIIAFPDLYEIGMGNQALKIIYNNLNGIKGISCDRAFAPAPDFEKLLRENKYPVYGLDTGISLMSVDLLMFTLGYELGLNGILTMLDVSGIPLHCSERGNDHPIIIAGGPAVSNPLPYSEFIDAFWIGEAEAGFFDLAEELARIKREGKGSSIRKVLLEKIASHPNIWVIGKGKTERAVAYNFSENAAVYPVPSMKIIHNHGTVEIMRGCPNGCRFCHAGFWYRPYRQKNPELIISQVNDLVTKGGWQEISISSLSSGDYTGIKELIENLNNKFKDKYISFQLPSLKVSGFSLYILEQISITRKSGLTFAVETPKDIWQMSINKEVTRNSAAEIINEAKKSGWKGAKFYFMIGLPLPDAGLSEEDEIVSFITDVGKRTRMHFNVNVGVYIPKPHTPYQYEAQIDMKTAEKKLGFIRSMLKPLGHKVSVSDLLISQIESLLSRGDEKAGLLCKEAWLSGSRLDPWSEFINKDKWHEILEKNKNYVNSVFSGQMKPLPWAQVKSLVSNEYLRCEKEKSDNSQRTQSCKEKCNLCGVCDKKHAEMRKNTLIIDKKLSVNHINKQVNNESNAEKSDPSIYRVVFSYSREGSAVFHGHLSYIEIFSMSFRRADIPVLYTKGFNPLAKMEFVSPLSTGISANNEIAAADFSSKIDTDNFIAKLNSSLPEGIKIKQAECFLIKSGMKKYSLSSLLWGFAYQNKNNIDYINAKEEKVYKQNRIDTELKSVFLLTRSEVLAKNVIDYKTEWVSYFDVYRHLYK